jgi:hypothetical protein
VEEALNIYEVLGVGPLRTRLQVSARRGLTRFVGRTRELEQIQQVLAQAKAGHGQIVGVMGEPGLGKSRLFYELAGAYNHTPLRLHGCLVLEAYSVSHGKATAYLPVIELLKSYFDIQSQDDERKRRERVIGKVGANNYSSLLDRSLEDTLPYLFAPAQAHLEQAFAFYNPEHYRDLVYQVGQDPGLAALGFAAETLWYRGYPDQAVEQARHALSLAQALAHPFSLGSTLNAVAFVHLFRREGQDAQVYAEASLTLAHEHGFALWLGTGTSQQGWALLECAAQSGAREQGEAGLVQLREGLAALRTTGTGLRVPLYLGALAQGCAQGGQTEDELRVVAEALAVVEKNEERWNEAELYRLKGELTLQQASQKSKGKSAKAQKFFQILNPKSSIPAPMPKRKRIF